MKKIEVSEICVNSTKIPKDVYKRQVYTYTNF